MSEIIDISGFRCTNHAPSKKAIASGIFDIHNPCSWCVNRKQKGRRGPVFHYVEYGRWEFPFIAETTCINFSLIHTAKTVTIDREAWRKAREYHAHRDRISQLSSKYKDHWMAFDFADPELKFAFNATDSRIIYPHGLNAERFFREASDLRADFFRAKMDLQKFHQEFSRTWSLRSTGLDRWMSHISFQMKTLSEQIDEIESNRDRIDLRTVSRWALGGVTGTAAWETSKATRKIIFELLA